VRKIEEGGMRKENEKRGQNKKISICVMIILGFIFANVSGCAAGFLGMGSTASWKEEVLLHDGSKIIVERWQKHGGRSEPGQGPGISDQSISFTIPGINKTVTWEDEASAELGGCANFKLLALHIMNNTPYIIAKPNLCLSYNKWGRPNPPYVIFKYEDREWKRIEIKDLPVEFKNINLAIDTLNDEEKLVSQGLVSAEMVKKLNRELSQQEYKEIARTPLKGVGCEKMVRVQGGWYGIDWFSSQPNHEACIKFCRQKNVKNEDCPCDSLFKGGK
jgi:hypothetical protein